MVHTPLPGVGSYYSLKISADTVGFVGAEGFADGNWDDGGEHVLDDVLAGNGLNSLPIDIPANAVDGSTFARVRVTDTAGYRYGTVICG